MRLTANQLKSIAHGAVEVKEENGGVRFYRFTEEQRALYKTTRSEGLYLKSLTSAGVRLVFVTDSKTLSVTINASQATTRSCFSYDIFVNGEMIGNIDNFSDMELPAAYSGIVCPVGEFSKEFDLGNGEKTVTIHLPWSVVSEIKELSLDDGAYLKAVERDKKLLVFGDSISQGYDAIRSSNHYTVKLADYLEADCYNKAIGGEIFIPELAKTKESFVPDYITVAYGTNDWSSTAYETFIKNCREFYVNLSQSYPEAKIFAISPIWRKNYRDEEKKWDFFEVATYIKEVADTLENVFFIDGFDFVPHQENMFADLYLHPNDKGFSYYYDSLRNEMEKFLK